jgi:hypothetical protein
MGFVNHTAAGSQIDFCPLELEVAIFAPPANQYPSPPFIAENDLGYLDVDGEETRAKGGCLLTSPTLQLPSLHILPNLFPLCKMGDLVSRLCLSSLHLVILDWAEGIWGKIPLNGQHTAASPII